jgi:hypothetical protein
MFACRLGEGALRETRIILLVRRSRLRRTGVKCVGVVYSCNWRADEESIGFMSHNYTEPSFSDKTMTNYAVHVFSEN